MSLYICPRTQEALEVDGAQLCSATREIRYAINNGIPNFLSQNPVEDGETQQQLIDLNRVARKDGWYAALSKVTGENGRPQRYVVDPKRLKLLDVMGLDASDHVLEIGPAVGLFTVSLARTVSHVAALEVVPGQAEFAAERCRQEGLQNVDVACGGDDCLFPYVTGKFDVVLLNLVFEWCGARDPDRQPARSQARMLEECFRVMKPGGSLWLTTKNRYALRYLLGTRDEHAYGLRFGNALPRWLMYALLHRRGYDGPSGLLHSHDALAGMLRSAGFGQLRSFWATPEMRYPEHFVETTPDRVRAARAVGTMIQGERRITRLLMPLIPARCVHHFTPGLMFHAVRLEA